MDDTRARGVFLFSVSVIGSLAALGISQVPQPWRGYVVLWLIFALTIGAFIMRLVRQHHEYRKLRLAAPKQTQPQRPAQRRRPGTDRLSVVRTRAHGSGRRVL
jgi:hypothetical protein